jgi:hypothetical protein
MQKGRIEKRHGAWHLRYRVDGKQVTRKLADYSDRYRTERSVRGLADEILEPLNAGRQVNGPMTLQAYIETVYFPNIKGKAKPSTYKGYFNLYKAQVQSRIVHDRRRSAIALQHRRSGKTLAPIVPEHQLVCVRRVHARSTEWNIERF